MREAEVAWPSRLFALVYALGTLLMAGYALWQYLMGAYDRILLPAILMLLLLGATLLRLCDHPARRLSAYLVLFGCYLLFAVDLTRLDDPLGLWIGLPPALALLLLPLTPALLINVMLTPVWLTLLGADETSLEALLAYLTVVVVGALAPWEQYRQRALVERTSPHDDECSALSSSTLAERLAGEHRRAVELGRRLSALVIHLPQLEMAHEQFGPELRLTLLEQFCRVARDSCRVHDVLGRSRESRFWLLLPDTEESGALMMCGRLLAALEDTALSETGAIDARIAACTLQADESLVAFEQRLGIKEQTLMEGPLDYR